MFVFYMQRKVSETEAITAPYAAFLLLPDRLERSLPLQSQTSKVKLCRAGNAPWDGGKLEISYGNGSP